MKVTDRRLMYRPCKNPTICSSFVLYPPLAVGAVDILASFTDGLSSLSVYPSAGAIHLWYARICLRALQADLQSAGTALPLEQVSHPRVAVAHLHRWRIPSSSWPCPSQAKSIS